MGFLRAFFAFWYDFLIGDDWGIAAGVVLTLALTWVCAHSLDATLAALLLLAGVLLTGVVALYRAAL